jgi:5-methylcytosine-specific restriction endonuclease McrA
MPLVRGGLHCRNNIVPACTRCNTSKWAHDPVEWMTGRASRAVALT